MLNDSLEPPAAPFAFSPTLRSRGSSPNLDNESSSVSLSLNYLPKKFSSRMLNAGNPRRRKNAGEGAKGVDPKFPKRGGGVDAFRSGEARMPSEGSNNDSDGWLAGRKTGKKMKWNRFKWILFCTNLCVRPIPVSRTPSHLILFPCPVHNLHSHRTYLIAPNLVQYLYSCRRRPDRQHSRTSTLHTRCGCWPTYIHHRLGRYPPQ